MNVLIRGAVSGLVATGAMSAVMLALRRQMGTQPPDAIATDAARAAGFTPTESEVNVMASIAHAGFGAVSGAAYALLPRYGPAPLRGVLVALGIWAAAYQGVVPALGILPQASRDKPGRPAVMIAAHLVFGAVLGSVEDRLRRR